MMWRVNLGVSQAEKKKHLVVLAVRTSLSFARWQQGEQTVAVVGVVFLYPLGSAKAPLSLLFKD